jgi:hypothetical protein
LTAIEATPAAGQFAVARETVQEPSLCSDSARPPERPLSETVIRVPSLEAEIVTTLRALTSVSV